MLQFLEPFQYLWNALTSERGPRQIAWGIALGVCLGMVPKGNLTAWLLGVLLLATRVNLGAGMLTAMTVTALSSLFDPLSHAVGFRLLQGGVLADWLVKWHNTPFVPWLRLNNTVVLGGAVLGLASLYPVQAIAFRIVSIWSRSRGDTDTNENATAEAHSAIPPDVQAALLQVTMARHADTSALGSDTSHV